MISKMEQSGIWWLPQKEEVKIPGVLSFSYDTGVRLNLQGNFDSDDLTDPYGNIILGNSSFDEPITVYGAYYTKMKYPLHDQTKGISSYVANKAFIGHHFPSKEDVEFDSIAFHPNLLDEWLRLKIFDISMTKNGFS
ncbi:hypothetical protein ACFLYP_04490, partial [Chloroflexota bacterium]